MSGFDNAPGVFGGILLEVLGTRALQGRLLRDIYGRLSFLTPDDVGEDERRALWCRTAQTLGAYGGSAERLVLSFSDDLSGLEALRSEPSISVPLVGSGELRLIDRRLAGGDWLTPSVEIVTDPVRLVFYSVKGGVGRSTALAVTAADLAEQGRNVLVIDLDLEAPGQGSMMLSTDGAPRYGVVDWFAAVAAGADADELLPDMIGGCPFTSSRAVVDVVPAVGAEPGDYLSKLARAYMPGSAGERYRGYSFPRKAAALIAGLSARRQYDTVLIDARAGLHETSGGLLLGLGAKSLIFGVDTPQTFDDYRLMFQALGHAFDPQVGGADTRNDIKMVHAKAPRDSADRQRFLEHGWDLWIETLYDDVEPTAGSSESAFTFDLSDESAPHYPLHIIADDAYARFDPRHSAYALSRDAYRPIFGGFLDGVRTLLGVPE